MIDCDFESLQMDKEIKSMASQIAYCHNTNKKQAQPCHIQVLGLGPKLRAKLDKYNISAWGVTYSDTNFLDYYMNEAEDKEKAKKSLVYLTADSENLLKKLDNKKVYVIGGLVDHNRHKLLTLKKANELGIKHARLPIQENIQLDSSAVLTVNHVFDLVCS